MYVEEMHKFVIIIGVDNIRLLTINEEAERNGSCCDRVILDRQCGEVGGLIRGHCRL